MKKRLLVSLLIFTFAAPAFGWACDCCPTAVSEFSNPPVLARAHDCCEMLAANQAGCAIEAKQDLLAASPRLFLPQSSPRGEFVPPTVERGSLQFPLAVSLGPPISSGTPLYLSLQILRL